VRASFGVNAEGEVKRSCNEVATELDEKEEVCIMRPSSLRRKAEAVLFNNTVRQFVWVLRRGRWYARKTIDEAN